VYIRVCVSSDETGGAAWPLIHHLTPPLARGGLRGARRCHGDIGLILDEKNDASAPRVSPPTDTHLLQPTRSNNPSARLRLLPPPPSALRLQRGSVLIRACALSERPLFVQGRFARRLQVGRPPSLTLPTPHTHCWITLEKGGGGEAVGGGKGR